MHLISNKALQSWDLSLDRDSTGKRERERCQLQGNKGRVELAMHWASPAAT
jgi:hypothetical protein